MHLPIRDDIRDPKLDKHRNNSSYKARISTYRGKKKYLISSFRGSYSLKNRRISSLVFSGGGQGCKSYNNTNAKSAKHKT